jgi:hypothetical protein
LARAARGKTTLLRIIMGDLAPTAAGSVPPPASAALANCQRGWIIRAAGLRETDPKCPAAAFLGIV